MKVLAIGNSYSQDATRYLHEIAKVAGDNLKVVNLFIGGCPLSLHYANIHNDDRAYIMEFNGEGTGFKVSIREALQSDEWDVVTVQQQSSRSADYATFQPYLEELCDYIEFHAPKAKIVLHQTWEYLENSRTLASYGYENPAEMFARVKASYAKAAEEMGIGMIIPAGETMANMRRLGLPHYRDDIHASLGVGRYALGLCWYGMLTGKPIDHLPEIKLDAPATKEELLLAVRAASDAIRGVESKL